MDLLKSCKSIIDEDWDILAIILCGSRARGDFKEGSDYDLMFITQLPEKKLNNKYEIEQQYITQISKKTRIDEHLLQISLWPIDYFEEEHRKGNSFIYCALRDGKPLFLRDNINLKQPNNCKKAAIDRLNLAKRNIESINISLDYFKKFMLSSLELEYLGYCSMHLCWAVCMFNNFCPISKYTVLRECRKYFTTNEFEIIGKTYQLYANQDQRKIRRKTFTKLFNTLKDIMKKMDDKYAGKEATKIIEKMN